MRTTIGRIREKLAIQVETLESDPTISICGHFVRQVTVDSQVDQPRVST